MFRACIQNGAESIESSVIENIMFCTAGVITLTIKAGGLSFFLFGRDLDAFLGVNERGSLSRHLVLYRLYAVIFLSRDISYSQVHPSVRTECR